MSDFIPPLVSSSPPPIPDFEDEDDDVEFGMDYNIGDLDLPETISENVINKEEKKKELLEIDARRLEINGTATNIWKCEEQDSTSQDSGLCMASQSSEGMSPLPQSDDEDKHTSNDNLVLNMKHSSTVMFNPDESNRKSDYNIEFNDNHLRSKTEDNMLINDTGQSEFGNSKLKDSGFLSSAIVEHGKTNGEFGNENYDSDNEFVWGTADNGSNLFQNHESYQINYCDACDNTESVNNKEIDEINDPLFAESDVHVEFSKSVNVCCNDSPVDGTPFVKDTKSITESSTVCNVNGIIDCKNSSVGDFETNNDNNICDSSINVSGIEVKISDKPEITLNNIEQTFVESNNETANDDFDDDDFGNFASVTVPENCDSLPKNDGLYSFNNSVGEFTPENEVLGSEHVNVVEKRLYHPDSSMPCNVLEDESDVHFKPTTLGVNTSVSDKPFSESLNNDNCSSYVSVTDLNKGNDTANSFDDDDFDDFSDFTQSVDIAESTNQHPDVSFKNVQPSCSSVLHQDGFEHIFPKPGSVVDSDSCIQQLEHGPVWKYLCPLENSPALTFQWSNSRAHNKLLSALSIDSRNILFGPHWNANIPRFAANLGSNPLQPIKAIEAQLPGGSSPVPLALDDTTSVPDAHFDWGSSGLTNPLDSGSHFALLDLEILSTFDSLTATSNNVPAKPITEDIEQLNKSCRTLSNKVGNFKLSAEAESIISLLPDLNFMKKTYIDFLTNKD